MYHVPSSYKFRIPLKRPNNIKVVEKDSANHYKKENRLLRMDTIIK